MLKRVLIVGAVAVLVVLATVSVALARKGPSERPFKADFVGAASWEFDDYGAEPCGPYQVGGDFEEGGFSVTTNTEATGNATHLGKTQASFTHCPTDSGYVNGHLTLTAANGDQVFIEYVDDGTTGDSFPLNVVNGTGRFKDAGGSMILSYWVEPIIGPNGEPDFSSPWGWGATVEGTISY
jgi:hypothetical protein